MEAGLSMRYQVAHHSLIGSRATNQDRVAVVERDNAVLLAVADGLGGHLGGALAAETLVQVAARAFQAVRQPVIDRPAEFLALTIMQAHQAIVLRGRRHQPPISPRTTCVLCLVQNGYAYWAHVGDSRLYHFRDGVLVNRTLDHTSVEQLHVDGLLSDSEMQTHPEKSRLLQCLGAPNKPVVSLGEETVLRRGDTLLLCSDGLWEALSPEDIARHLRGRSLEEGIDELVHAAEDRHRGRCDNISAASLRWEDTVTAVLPQQPAPARQMDDQTLRSGAHHRLAVERSRAATDRTGARKKPTAPAERKKSLEETIKELEDYIRRFEGRN